MSTALIFFSTHSEAAQQKAKELGIDYSGHDRICSVLANATIDDISKAVVKLSKLAIAEGGSTIIHDIVLHKLRN